MVGSGISFERLLLITGGRQTLRSNTASPHPSCSSALVPSTRPTAAAVLLRRRCGPVTPSQQTASTTAGRQAMAMESAAPSKRSTTRLQEAGCRRAMIRGRSRATLSPTKPATIVRRTWIRTRRKPLIFNCKYTRNHYWINQSSAGMAWINQAPEYVLKDCL